MQVSLHYYLFSHYFLGYFAHLILDMKFKISMSSQKTTTNTKKQTNQKEILDGLSLNLCIKWERIGIFAVLSLFLQGHDIHFIYSGLLLFCHGIFQLIWYSDHTKMRNRMKYLYKLILRRVCVRMTYNAGRLFLSKSHTITYAPLNVCINFSHPQSTILLHQLFCSCLYFV